jgi:hypothetical protein
MNTVIVLIAVIAATIPTIIELRRDGLHRLTWRDDWRGLRSRY